MLKQKNKLFAETKNHLLLLLLSTVSMIFFSMLAPRNDNSCTETNIFTYLGGLTLFLLLLVSGAFFQKLINNKTNMER